MAEIGLQLLGDFKALGVTLPNLRRLYATLRIDELSVSAWKCSVARFCRVVCLKSSLILCVRIFSAFVRFRFTDVASGFAFNRKLSIHLTDRPSHAPFHLSDWPLPIAAARTWNGLNTSPWHPHYQSWRHVLEAPASSPVFSVSARCLLCSALVSLNTLIVRLKLHCSNFKNLGPIVHL